MTPIGATIPTGWVDRPEVMRRVLDWWDDADAPRLLVVAGRFGTGKSVVLAQVAARLRDLPGMLVVERLRLRGADRALAAGDPDSFVTGVGDALDRALGQGRHQERTSGNVHIHIETHAGSVGSVTAVGGDALSLAVAGWANEVVPLLVSAVRAGRRPVLVIDALDELDSALVDALTDRIIPELPVGVSVVVSGRPDLPGALLAPGGVAPVEVNLDGAEAGGDEDIARYAASRLQDLAPSGGLRVDRLLEQVVANAEGKFLYARWVLDDLVADPDVDLATWTPPPGMTALYDQFLARVQRRAGDRWPEVAEVLASVAASLDPGLSLGQLAEIHGLEVQTLRRWLREWCGHYVEADARDRVRVGHASLAAHWLDLDPSAPGRLGVDSGDAHDRLARWCAQRRLDEATPEYAVRNAVAHAANAAMATADEALTGPRHARLAAVATSWPWLVERQRRDGTGPLLGDLALASREAAGCAEASAMLVASLERVVRREAHHLSEREADDLAAQLLVTAVRRREVGLSRYLRSSRSAPDSDAALLASWCDRSEGGYLTAVFSGHTDWVGAVCALEDGRVVSAGLDATVRVWDLDRPEVDPVVLAGHTGRVWAVCALEDGRVVSAGDDATVRVWDLDRPEVDPVVLSGHSDWVRAVCALGDGRVVSGGVDATVRVWDLDRPEVDPVVLSGHTGRVRALCALGDGRVVSGGDDATVRVWDPDRPEVDPTVLSGHTRRVSAVCALGDGRVVSAGDDGTVRLWDPDRPDATPTLLSGHTRRVLSVCALADGRVASGAADATVRVWDPDRPQVDPVVLWGHTGRVLAVCVSGDGRVVSAGGDATLRLWDPDRPHDPCLAVVHVDEPKALASDGRRRVVTGHRDGTVMTWDVVGVDGGADGPEG